MGESFVLPMVNQNVSNWRPFRISLTRNPFSHAWHGACTDTFTMRQRGEHNVSPTNLIRKTCASRSDICYRLICYLLSSQNPIKHGSKTLAFTFNHHRASSR